MGLSLDGLKPLFELFNKFLDIICEKKRKEKKHDTALYNEIILLIPPELMSNFFQNLGVLRFRDEHIFALGKYSHFRNDAIFFFDSKINNSVLELDKSMNKLGEFISKECVDLPHDRYKIAPAAHWIPDYDVRLEALQNETLRLAEDAEKKYFEFIRLAKKRLVV